MDAIKETIRESYCKAHKKSYDTILCSDCYMENLQNQLAQSGCADCYTEAVPQADLLTGTIKILEAEKNKHEYDLKYTESPGYKIYVPARIKKLNEVIEVLQNIIDVSQQTV
jgi:protein-arginine kinase activator protein McsA